MYVCLCFGVSDKHLKELIDKGVVSVRGLQQQCRVGADCGSCLFKVREMLNQCGNKNSESVAATLTASVKD